MAWVNKLPEREVPAVKNSHFLPNCRDLILSGLEIDRKARINAQELQNRLYEVFDESRKPYKRDLAHGNPATPLKSQTPYIAITPSQAEASTSKFSVDINSADNDTDSVSYELGEDGLQLFKAKATSLDPSDPSDSLDEDPTLAPQLSQGTTSNGQDEDRKGKRVVKACVPEMHISLPDTAGLVSDNGNDFFFEESSDVSQKEGIPGSSQLRTRLARRSTETIVNESPEGIPRPSSFPIKFTNPERLPQTLANGAKDHKNRKYSTFSASASLPRSRNATPSPKRFHGSTGSRRVDLAQVEDPTNLASMISPRRIHTEPSPPHSRPTVQFHPKSHPPTLPIITSPARLTLEPTRTDTLQGIFNSRANSFTSAHSNLPSITSGSSAVTGASHVLEPQIVLHPRKLKKVIKTIISPTCHVVAFLSPGVITVYPIRGEYKLPEELPSPIGTEWNSASVAGNWILARGHSISERHTIVRHISSCHFRECS